MLIIDVRLTPDSELSLCAYLLTTEVSSIALVVVCPNFSLKKSLAVRDMRDYLAEVRLSTSVC